MTEAAPTKVIVKNKYFTGVVTPSAENAEGVYICDAKIHENARLEAFPDEVMFTGRIKWDGCTDWWDGEEGAGFHTCGDQSPDHLRAFGDILAQCWDAADKLMVV